MDINEAKQKLSELEERIAETENQIANDKITLLYLKGYLDGLDFARQNDY